MIDIIFICTAEIFFNATTAAYYFIMYSFKLFKRPYDIYVT